MKTSYQMMCMQLASMNIEEINHQLSMLGCPLTYDQIKEELKGTYNELSVSDHIFDAFAICDQNSMYETNFIDEAVIEIARRETFGFTHYCILSTRLHELSSKEDSESLKEMESCFEKLFQLAKKFKLTSLEGMIYDVNDGVNLYAILIDFLSKKMSDVMDGKIKPKAIIDFTERYFRIFTQNSDYLKASILYEQAKAYIMMRSSKGEAIFQNLLQEHSDFTEVVFHYALAYVDDNPKKALRILTQYESKLDQENVNYEMIQELKHELSTK